MQQKIPFGEWLRKQRRALDLSRQAFAKQVGCAEVTLRRIEAGTLKPSKELANLLLEKLGIPDSERPQWISFARGLTNPRGEQEVFPPTASITNLPAPLTSFVGREKEQREVIELIGKHRLVTVIGSGGVGKTRFAIKIGKQLLDSYPDGVWLVEFASLSDPTLVAQAVATLFGLITQFSISHTDLLINFLRTKSTLLILDNCEHLVDASAQLADTLLKNCPNLKILVTSREPLEVSGEARYRVPSLGLPDLQYRLDTLRDCESVKLFEERAQLLQFDFSLTQENASFVVQICRRLDGIPLAIELAAAKVGVFSPRQIAKQLEESFNLLMGGSRSALPRHKTLRASMDWSWGLLTESEQRLIRQVSVFVGGWMLEAAQSICDGDVLYLLNSLVAKSLIIMNERTGTSVRFFFHETISQYAHEKLLETGEVMTMRDKHRDVFLAYVEKAAPEILCADQKKWIDDLEDEQENIRAALSWSVENHNAEQALRFCSGLTIFWERHKHYHEAAQACQSALACVTENENLKTTAWYASVLASTAFYIAVTKLIPWSDPAIRIPFEQAKKIYDEVDDYTSTGPVLTSQVLVYIYMGENDLLSAEQCVSAWYDKVSASGYQWGVALAKRSLAELSERKGNVDSALALWEESYALFMQIGDVWAAREVSRSLILQKVRRGEFEGAIGLVKQNLLFYEEYGDPGGVADSYDHLGIIAQERGQYDSAKRYFTQALSLRVEIGNPVGIIFAIERTAYLLYLQGKVEEARAEYQTVLTRLQDLAGDSSYGLFHARFAQISLREKHFEEARKLLSVGLEILQRNNQKVDLYAAYYGFGELSRLESNYSEAIEHYCASLNAVQDGSLYIELPRIIDGIAKTEYVRSKFNKAAQLFGASQALRKKMSVVIHAVDLPVYNKHIKWLKSKMKVAEFESAWAEGAKMNADELYEYAMKESKGEK